MTLHRALLPMEFLYFQWHHCHTCDIVISSWLTPLLRKFAPILVRRSPVAMHWSSSRPRKCDVVPNCGSGLVILWSGTSSGERSRFLEIAPCRWVPSRTRSRVEVVDLAKIALSCHFALDLLCYGHCCPWTLLISCGTIVAPVASCSFLWLTPSLHILLSSWYGGHSSLRGVHI